MTDANGWLRLDYGFPEHRKIIGLSDAAFRAHVEAMAWSGRAGTNGHIPAAAAARYAKPATCRALVDAGAWDALPDGSYTIHDWGDYQPPTDPTERARWFNAERQRRHRSGRRDRNA
jgi:hypothetical protein